MLDRFGQIKPKVLIAANGYRYGGKSFDCQGKLARILEAIDSIEHLVMINYDSECPITLEHSRLCPWESWEESAPLESPYELFSFNHPLYIMYSSGTTGIPKCIVHGAGGTLLQHAKELLLHCDLRREDTIMYFTTCGWMMWNWLVSSLFVGATIVLYDGSPTHPDFTRLWALAENLKVSHFGTSPKFLGSCRSQNLQPSQDFDLSNLRVLLSTGAPLLPEDFDWVYQQVKTDVQLSSISGGTDIISCFMLGNPTIPVVRGEIQCLGLGMDVVARNDEGQAVLGEKGELVCRTPFPSMPVSFWNDAHDQRYQDAYFEHGPNAWHHGDYIELTGSQGSCGGIVVHGRSDATLNPGGVRIGTAEIYRIVETMPEVQDSIVVGQPWEGDVRVVLFVQLATHTSWSEQLSAKIRQNIREGATPRHVPAVVAPVPAIPYTISGKKVELAVRQILEGKTPKNLAALANPEALDAFQSVSSVS